MELRVFLAVLCTVAFLFCSVSAAGISFDDIIIRRIPGFRNFDSPTPPPEGGSILQRKALDSQPHFYKSSTRLLREAEISRDLRTRNGKQRW